MHVLALANQKGGCGKTTTAINLAGALSALGDRVLLVDLDPQAHATLGLGQDIEGGGAPELSAVDVLRGEATLADSIRPAPGGLHLLPASLELAEFEEKAQRMIRPERVLERALASETPFHDWVVVDCPPRADGVLTANALRASDTVVLVVETGAFALQGAVSAERIFHGLARDLDRELRIRVLATLFDRRTRFGREVLLGMHARFGERMYDTAIRESVRLREAAAFGTPVQVLDPRCRAAGDFAALAEEVRREEARRAETDVLSPHASPSPTASTSVPPLGSPLPPEPESLRGG